MFLRTSALIVGLSCSLSAATIVSTVGDEDALGTGTPTGGELPNILFDNRSPEEAAAVNGAELTDFADFFTGFGPTFEASGVNASNAFSHAFLLPPNSTIISATWELGIGGLQTNDDDPNTSGLGEDALFFDGIELNEAFAGVDQEPREYDIFSFDLTPTILAELSDGQVDALVALNSNAGFGPVRSEPVYYDFSRLTIVTTPEPSSFLLLGAGALAFALVRRRKR